MAEPASDRLEHNLFAYIWRHNRREQIAVIAVVLLSLPFYFLSLNLPKLIVNGPIQGGGFEREGATQPFLHIAFDVPGALREWFGEKVTLLDGAALDRMDSLFALSAFFLLLVCINGLFKFRINTMKGLMGERLLRRMRYELVDRVLRFPVGHFRKVRQAEVASMVKDEVEPIGGFIGDAYAQPLFLGGQALTALLFILVQSLWLGLVAAGVVLFQAFVIPKLRRPILRLGRTRQLQARDLAGRVGEIVDGIGEVHTHDTSNYERADITQRLGKIFFIRFEIYQRKYFVKFLNNFLAQLTPFIFYAAGGYLAIKGSLSIGELVAVINAYKDLPGPIKELIDWDLQRQDAQIKYEQVIEQFSPEGMARPELQAPLKGPAPALRGAAAVSEVSATDEAGVKLLDGVRFEIPLHAHVAFSGSPGGGKEAAAALLARLVPWREGRVLYGGEDLQTMKEAVSGRRIAYLGPDAYVFPASLRDNVLYSLKHEPLAEAAPGKAMSERERREAERAGNAPFDPNAEWVDYTAARCASAEEMDARILALAHVAGLDEDIYQFGLKSRLDRHADAELIAKILTARVELKKRLGEPENAGLVEPFDAHAYNRNATLAENLLFGTPLAPEYEPSELARNADVAGVLNETGLTPFLLEAGRTIAQTMIELFRDLPADHPFFEQFSFVSAAELPEAQAMLNRAAGAPSLLQLGQADRARLMGLSFRYVEARHRLGLITEETSALVLGARRKLGEAVKGKEPPVVAHYGAESYVTSASLADNILMGRVAYGLADGPKRVQRLVAEVLDDLGLREAVLREGLEAQAGAAGRRLSAAQRQKIGLMRALIKEPDLLIVNQGLAVLDSHQQKEIRARVLAERKGRGVIWTVAPADAAEEFSRVLVFEHGKLAEDRALAAREKTRVNA